MAKRFHRIWCDECGVEITWTPVVIDHRHYCCHDCAIGLECDCDSLATSWEEEVEFPWVEGVAGGTETTYGIDHSLD